MRVVILTYLEMEGAADHDVVVDQVARALGENGHEASILGVHGDVEKLITGIRQYKPDLVFNLMEMFADNIFDDIGVAGLLDLLRVPYTGSGPGEFYLQQDKALAKKLLDFENIKYPNFAVFTKEADIETGGHLHMPLFVKPLRTDASIGITSKALVHTTKEMWQRVLAIDEEFNDSALAEEFIEGREFYVGVLGNLEPAALPVIEMDFSGLKDGAPRVLDGKAKWEADSAEYKGTRAVLAELPDDLRARLQKAALDAYRLLRVKDYGRVDLRFTDAGDIYVLEVNANCYLEQASEFATAARAAGMEYPSLINRIAELALERFKRNR